MTRWWAFVPDRSIHCADGHHISNSLRVPVHECGFMRCTHVTARGGPPCARWVFVYRFPGGRAIVADITGKEQRALEEMRSAAEMLEFLAIWPARCA